MAGFAPGQIVLVDWRDALPKEPNKLRPAIVVEDGELFDRSYPNVILVPLSDDSDFVMADLASLIEPTPENGCSKRCYALSHCVTTNSMSRVTPTRSLTQRVEALRAAGWNQLVIPITPGEERAIEDWARIKDAFG